ncbi:endo-1,4-beta-xylanase [Bacillus suaedae]|uniref:Beta-xylanase n=1 Tax=Halalkalibacter suaedae TaxID=2822140 RepID=A0A940WSR4_9BACI|nr:endo-1,4-beta-xylanase [Bacillus suaedae]MBP3951601.1 endo-1,4-beta-xylanase [Bacillus suaedae]
MSRNFKKLVSLLLVAILVVPSSLFTQATQAATEKNIPVLLYHRIVDNPTNEWTDTSIETFEQTMKYLNDNGYNTLSATQYVSIMEGTEEAPENPILLTFDDATPDFITNTLPILKQYEMNSVLFVVSDWIGGGFSMSAEQLETLVNEPSVSIENHSKTHDQETVWNGEGDLTKEKASEEIAEANVYLKSITGKDPLLMAYPYGAYNADAEAANAENGIKYAFKVGYPDSGNYAMGRHYIMMDTTLEEIAGWIGGPAPIADPVPEVQPSTETVYHETFDSGLGVATQAGGATLEAVSDMVFVGNEDGKALYVSNRTNNWDSVDIKFDDVGMENSKTYTITIRGYVADSVSVPEGAQALLQNIDSYDGLYVNTNYVAGEAFTLTGQYTVDTSKDSALRIQSNTEGAAVPFYIGDILITEEGTSGGGDEPDEPEEQRPPAEEFKTITFEDQTTGGFEGRHGSELLTVTDEANHTENGSYALKVENRTDTWHGPTLNVAKYVDKGAEYTVSAWVKLISPDSSQLQLSTQVGNGDGSSYNNIQGTTVSKEDDWVKLEGTYRYSSVGNEFLTIYVESSNNSEASFYIDDISFEPTGSAPIEIEKDLTPIKDAYQDYFLIGNAVSLTEFEGQRLELLNMHHNVVTAENAMKPGYTYNDAGEFDFTAEDELVSKALAEGQKVVGHVLVWHQQSVESQHTDADGNPLPREVALENLRTHVKTVVEHFGEDVISWDVVNEAMNDNPSNPTDWKASLRQSGWWKAIGPDYIKEAFIAAKEALGPDSNVQLYYNDYNDDNQNKATAIYHMIKEINEEYAAENNGERLIDGMGMQSHYNLSTNPENVRSSLEMFVSLGLEVSITELDVTAGSNNVLTEEEAIAQGYLYAQLFKLYKEYKDNIARVTIWGLNDSTSWRAAQNPLLFDANLQAKPAYYAIMNPDQFIAENPPKEKNATQAKALRGTPVIDGVADDAWSVAPTLDVNRYQMAWQGASGEAKVLWDDQNLYVLVKVSDSQLDKSAANAWEQDSVEVFLDQNNAKTSSYEAEGDGQYRVNFDNETSFNPAAIAEGFESATNVAEGGYTVEFKIPLNTITPELNKKIGFDIQINDAKDGARESAATWNDMSGVGYQDTSVFGEVTLVNDLGTEDPVIETPGGENPGTGDPGSETPGDKDPGNENPGNENQVKEVTEDDLVITEDEKVFEVKTTSDSFKFSKSVLNKLGSDAEILITNGKARAQVPVSILLLTGADHVTFNFGEDLSEKYTFGNAQAVSAVYDFTITDASGNAITEFGDERVTLMFTVSADNINNVVIWYIDEDGNATSFETKVTGENEVSADVNHFSMYGAFEVEASANPKPSTPELGTEGPSTEVPNGGDTEQPKAEDPVKGNGVSEKLPNTATNFYTSMLMGVLLVIAGFIVYLASRRREAIK